MDAFRIQGGNRLSGRIALVGSKNASLPLMAAALLADAPLTLRRIPNLSDISNMLRLLEELGCSSNAKHGTHGFLAACGSARLVCYILV